MEEVRHLFILNGKVNVASLSAVILVHAWIMEGCTNEMIVQQSPNEQKLLKGSHTRKWYDLTNLTQVLY